MKPSPEDECRFRLLMKGYWIHDGNLWYIENDDPDNYQENMIGPSDGSYTDAWQALNLRDWPKVQAWGEMYV